MKTAALPVGTVIDFYGLRRVVDVHNRPAGMILLVTNRGEFELPANHEIEESE